MSEQESKSDLEYVAKKIRLADNKLEKQKLLEKLAVLIDVELAHLDNKRVGNVLG